MRYHVVLMMVVTSLLLVSSSYGEEEEEGLAVKTLTTSDFDELTSSGVWMIKFYAYVNDALSTTHTHTYK
jgi:hypothetical protein